METYFENMSAKEGSSRRLVQDLGILVRDAEALLGTVVEDLTDKSSTDLRARVDKLKESCKRFERHAAAGVRRADKIVRRRPAQAVGIAFFIGLILGLSKRR